jgi:hypothetical protein
MAAKDIRMDGSPPSTHKHSDPTVFRFDETSRMTTCELVVAGMTPSISKKLLSKCRLFLNKPNLLELPYIVRSHVELQDFLVFLDALHGRQHQITIENVPQLLNLCSELGYAPFEMSIVSR